MNAQSKMVGRVRAHTLVDNVTRYFDEVKPMPKGRRGKFWKDGQTARGVQDYLADKFIDSHLWPKKGRYEPSLIVRNFFM